MKCKVKALSLFSGGLDSILATRVIMAQGIEVEAIQFVTPFFNHHLLEDVEGHKNRMREKYGIEVTVVDISQPYLEMLHHPDHGFGKNFNPCIDCKIMMFSMVREMLEEKGASFLITGEVLGQRPMSQRRDTLNVIERDSGTKTLLLRPLSAQLMVETEAEKQGLVDRSRLLRMSGRGRSAQMKLAEEYGIIDYPSPAGGCILADPILSRRIEKLYDTETVLQAAQITVPDVRILLMGRQFLLPEGGWLILGRDQRDNGRLHKLATEDDAVLRMEDWPGPLAVLKKAGSRYSDEAELDRDLQRAAALVVRFGKKRQDGPQRGLVVCRLGAQKRTIEAEAARDESFADWALQ